MDFMKVIYLIVVYDKLFFLKRKKKKDYEVKFVMVFLENW